MYVSKDMAKEYQLVALDVLDSFKSGMFPYWANYLLNRFEEPPWPTRRKLPVGRARAMASKVGIMGLPSSGKSFALEYLKNSLDMGERLVVIPELQFTDELFSETHRASDINAITPLGWEFVQHYYEHVKLAASVHSMGESIRLLREEALNRRRMPSLVISERDANDALAFFYWITFFALHKKEPPQNYEEPILEGEMTLDQSKSVYPGFAKTNVELFLHALAYAQEVDAVVLYHVSLETAQRRRELTGKPREGKVVNPEKWPALEKGYSWWLGSIYPLLRQYHGTGLLIIDGEQPVARNNALLLRYCQSLVRLQGF